ncbi:MAG: ParA family protein [Actinomycetota bacterium]
MGEGTVWKLLERSPRRASGARLVSIANQKGGVGKTTTAINLAAGLAQRGHRVLVVDVDPQSNATTGLGIDHRDLRHSTYQLVLGEAMLSQVVVATAVPGLDCAPGSPHLAGAEIELVGAQRREHQLAEALAPARERYDVVLLDCPPSLGLLTVNAVVAADELVVPVQCEYYALEGLGQLLDTAERVRGSLNPRLRITGFLLTMYDARTKLSGQVAEEVRGHFGDLVYGTVIPRSVRLSEAPSFGEPVLTLDPGARGSIAYKLLAAEVESRLGLGRPAPERAGATRAPSPARPGTPGPAGRGYGTSAPEPPGLDEAHPRLAPWEPTR